MERCARRRRRRAAAQRPAARAWALSSRGDNNDFAARYCSAKPIGWSIAGACPDPPDSAAWKGGGWLAAVAERARAARADARAARQLTTRRRPRESPARPGTVVVCAFGALITEPLLSSHRVPSRDPSFAARGGGAAPIGARESWPARTRPGCDHGLTAGVDSGGRSALTLAGERRAETYGSAAQRLAQPAAICAGGARPARPTANRSIRRAGRAGCHVREKIDAQDRLLGPARSAADAGARRCARWPAHRRACRLPDGGIGWAVQEGGRSWLRPRVPTRARGWSSSSEGRCCCLRRRRARAGRVQPSGGRRWDAGASRGTARPGRCSRSPSAAGACRGQRRGVGRRLRRLE